ncbi:LGFP repeat-containing protein, partial [Corynebacterium glucuronolyticum]
MLNFSHLGSSSLNSGATEHRISVDELSVHESDVSNPAAGISGPFAERGFPTPPGAESYQVNQVSEDNLAPQGLEEWHPTDDPKETIAEGQMRLDHETVPEDFTKADADKAETTEAYLQTDAVLSLRTATGCSVYWPSWFEVCGAIKTKYDQIGGPTSFLNLPKSNELTNPNGVGKRSEFVNGFIYWHPDTGAQSVSIPVSKVWQRHGWEHGFLGYPITSDMTLGDQWFKQDFQGGHVYTHHNAVPVSQASIQGAIYDKWQSMGAQKSELGYPISDELTTPDGVRRYNVF